MSFFLCNFAAILGYYVSVRRNQYEKEDKTMARPIAETPILFGADARRFEERMRHPRKTSAEELAVIKADYELLKSMFVNF